MPYDGNYEGQYWRGYEPPKPLRPRYAKLVKASAAGAFISFCLAGACLVYPPYRVSAAIGFMFLGAASWYGGVCAYNHKPPTP